MRRALLASLLLAWWFMAYQGHGSTVVGPFKDESDCREIRKWFDREHHTSRCWWDGKP